MAYCYLVAKTPARGWWCTSGESAGASTYKFFINDLDGQRTFTRSLQMTQT